ncbi:hypothetical protein L484_007635 [Morus notabilis]|uniref:Uncharacterized protein n=1 Tax=Morus notabilis TaxID=981085 RepID=W9QW22_9ROSA|nr:hypothetical protein L484_007635 [Morus notabilis]
MALIQSTREVAIGKSCKGNSKEVSKDYAPERALGKTLNFADQNAISCQMAFFFQSGHRPLDEQRDHCQAFNVSDEAHALFGCSSTALNTSCFSICVIQQCRT